MLIAKNCDLGEQKIGVGAQELLANGFLSGKITRDTVFEKNHLNARYPREEIIERVEYLEKMDFLLRGEIDTWPKAAMRWILDKPNVSLVLSGARNRAEILEYIQASNAQRYSETELARSQELHSRDFQAA